MTDKPEEFDAKKMLYYDTVLRSYIDTDRFPRSLPTDFMYEKNDGSIGKMRILPVMFSVSVKRDKAKEIHDTLRIMFRPESEDDFDDWLGEQGRPRYTENVRESTIRTNEAEYATFTGELR